MRGASGAAWKRELLDAVDTIESRFMRVFRGVAQDTYESIVVGSPVTGAPGQPVDTGALRASWQLTFPKRTRAEIMTRQVYAAAIEDGVGRHGPLTLRSQVGGFHSVKLTIGNFDLLVEDVVRNA
jgi:hypothetical protein